MKLGSLAAVELRGRERAFGALAILAGLGLGLLVQVGAPVGVPLYDGVVVAEPYRYLHPVGTQIGDPPPASKTVPVTESQSPLFAVYTSENPAQAQIVAEQGAFQLPSGTTQVSVSITAVEATVQPTAGSIAGNVYRFAATGASGASLTPSSCDNCRTLVLRAPADVSDGTIAHLENGAWVLLQTEHAGLAAMFQINAPALGDYAVIAGTGPAPSPTVGGIDPLIFGGIALAVFFAVVAALFWYRRRPAPVPVARLGTRPGRVPSKRRGPRRPPGGRSGS